MTNQDPNNIGNGNPINDETRIQDVHTESMPAATEATAAAYADTAETAPAAGTTDNTGGGWWKCGCSA